MTLLSALLSVIVVQAQVPSVPRELSLGKAERVLSQEFTQIRGVRELPDGRVSSPIGSTEAL